MRLWVLGPTHPWNGHWFLLVYPLWMCYRISGYSPCSCGFCPCFQGHVKASPPPVQAPTFVDSLESFQAQAWWASLPWCSCYSKAWTAYFLPYPFLWLSLGFWDLLAASVWFPVLDVSLFLVNRWGDVSVYWHRIIRDIAAVGEWGDIVGMHGRRSGGPWRHLYWRMGSKCLSWIPSLVSVVIFLSLTWSSSWTTQQQQCVISTMPWPRLTTLIQALQLDPGELNMEQKAVSV